MSNVQEQATPSTVYEDVSDAADAILDRWSDGENLSEDEELEATDEATDETEGAPDDIDEDDS